MYVITVLEIILLCVGVYFVMFKIGWMSTHMHLYDMRKYYSSKKYYDVLKKCDIALSLHYFKMILFGLYLILSAIGLTYDILCFLIFIGLIGCCDIGIVLIERKNSLNSLKESIIEQWKIQDKVSETNDDEVRVVNAVKKLKYTIVRSMIMYAIILIVDGLMFM